MSWFMRTPRTRKELPVKPKRGKRPTKDPVEDKAKKSKKEPK